MIDNHVSENRQIEGKNLVLLNHAHFWNIAVTLDPFFSKRGGLAVMNGYEGLLVVYVIVRLSLHHRSTELAVIMAANSSND